MLRKAFLMKVLPGKISEYRRMHDEIWPELADTMKRHGASNYSIFLHFAVRKRGTDDGRK